jgi:hypothetical protein
VVVYASPLERWTAAYVLAGVLFFNKWQIDISLAEQAGKAVLKKGHIKKRIGQKRKPVKKFSGKC